MANQLRAHLRNVFPGAVGLFCDLNSRISLALLTRFTTQTDADWLTPKRLGAWLAKQRYSGKVAPEVLRAAPRGVTGQDATTQAHITQALLAVLTTLVDQIKTLTSQIGNHLDAHAEQHIFTSLPKAGRVPTPESMACLAGAAPSNRQSGKLRTVNCR